MGTAGFAAPASPAVYAAPERLPAPPARPQELTSRYGGYYIFTITTPPEQEGGAEAAVRRMSPGARLTYALAGTRKYELPVGEVTLAGIFDAMEAAKQHVTVLDWGVANATLEEVRRQAAWGECSRRQEAGA